MLRRRSSTCAESDFDDNIAAFDPAISAGVFLWSTDLPASDLSCANIEPEPIVTFNYIMPFDFLVVLEQRGCHEAIDVSVWGKLMTLESSFARKARAMLDIHRTLS